MIILASSLFITKIPFDCKITNFSLCLFACFYFFILYVVHAALKERNDDITTIKIISASNLRVNRIHNVSICENSAVEQCVQTIFSSCPLLAPVRAVH